MFFLFFSLYFYKIKQKAIAGAQRFGGAKSHQTLFKSETSTIGITLTLEYCRVGRRKLFERVQQS